MITLVVLISHHLKHLSSFPGAPYTVEDIKRLISIPGRSARTRNGDRRSLHAYMEWCVKHDYCGENPVARIDPAKVEEQRPKILSIEEVKTLLRAAKDYKKGVMMPYFALSLFAGLRPAELGRISMHDIDLSSKLLILDGSAAKLRKRRNVDLTDNLAPWITPYQAMPVVGKNWRRDFEAVRRLAGFFGREIENSDQEKMKPWSDDVLRHTAISYHLAFFKHEGETAGWAGNSPDVVQRHYKGLVKPADAAEFWSLVPEKLENGRNTDT